MAGKVKRNPAGKHKLDSPLQGNDMKKQAGFLPAQERQNSLNRRYGRWLLLVILLIAVALPAMIYINPQQSKKIAIQPKSDGYELALQPVFSAPQNVQMKGIANTGGAYDSLVITWNKVPGARGYRIYSSMFIPDTTLWVPRSQIINIDGVFYNLYQYSYHPTYGDVYAHFLNNGDMSQAPFRMWNKGIINPWVRDSSGVMNGCRYSIPVATGTTNPNRIYNVKAWR